MIWLAILAGVRGFHWQLLVFRRLFRHPRYTRETLAEARAPLTRFARVKRPAPDHARGCRRAIGRSACNSFFMASAMQNARGAGNPATGARDLPQGAGDRYRRSMSTLKASVSAASLRRSTHRSRRETVNSRPTPSLGSSPSHVAGSPRSTHELSLRKSVRHVDFAMIALPWRSLDR